MTMQQTRRQWLGMALLLPASAVFPASVRANEPVIKVAKTRTCGCCKVWVDYLSREGFTVEATDMAAGQLSRFKAANGIKPDLASCHTATVGGYVVEGHVPVREIKRLLAEKPDAIGLTVPGMPLGSPGMDFGPEKEPYDVFLIKRDGTTEVYARYGAKG